MSDTIREMAEKLRAELQEKVDALKATPQMAEVLSLHRALNGLEESIQRERTTLAEVFGLAVEAGGSSSARRGDVLKAWEFTDMKPLEAAKHYLKKVGEPRMIDDIVAAIRDHGGAPGSVEHLKTALTRSTLDVVKIKGRGDMYGLVEFFPGMKRTGRWGKGKKAGAGNGDEAEEPEDAAEEAEENTAEEAESSGPEEGSE